MANSPSNNEAILQQLRNGLAEFELTISPVPSVSSYGPSKSLPSTALAADTHRFFARIGPSIGGRSHSPALKKAQRFSVQKVTGDGRCLFRALVKGMAFNKGMALGPREERENADELRMAVKEVICDNDKERSHYQEALIAITVEESLNRYCQRIGRSDFWGGESELLVLSKLCCQPITVYIPEHEHSGQGYGFIPIAEYGAQFSKGSRKEKPRKIVLEKALEVWDLQVIPLDSPVAEPAHIAPENENAFICHLQNHWFCIRKVNGEWYNFNSLYAAPEHLSKFYLSAYLSSLRGSGWSIFLLRGKFPKECPIVSSESSNGYGQWLSPEDAGRIAKSCNSTWRTAPGSCQTRQFSDSYVQYGDGGILLDEDDEDLKAAIAASLMDSASAGRDIPAGLSDEIKNSGEENIQ